ncbi:hypothetical protein [Streptomyces sp. NPDC008122]|uniref:hypothetical protein n=1 Tax=Streptomyces sp. NPDC008122 TaxID=3364810 RepID=UPI0036EEF5D4
MKLVKPEFHPLLKLLGNAALFVLFASNGYLYARDGGSFHGIWRWIVLGAVVFMLLGAYRGGSLAWREWRGRRSARA